MFGSSNVEIAPYTVIASDKVDNIQVRNYEYMVLASTPMTNDKSRNSAFRILFNYITGENIDQSKIPMTAPVFMDKDANEAGKDIPMTAPVFMGAMGTNEPMMSFVLPKEYTLETAPKPTNDAVKLSALQNYTVAVIQFSGTLSESNIAKHKNLLEEWIEKSEYKATAPYQYAGYNAPFTLPMFRRNEVLIPVAKK